MLGAKQDHIFQPWQEELYGVVPPIYFQAKPAPSTGTRLAVCDGYGTEELTCHGGFKPISRMILPPQGKKEVP